MKRSHPFVSLLALMTAGWLGPRATAATLATLLDDSRSTTYQAPSADELAQAQLLFQRTFDNPADATLAADWAALGFQRETVHEHDRPLTVIRERPEQLRGRGFYAFAAAPADAPMLQAPHARSDLYTGDIVTQLFAQGQFAAAAWSTVPRGYEGDDGSVNADMAHLPASYFIAFSTAAVRSRPTSAIVQWHGFAQEKRKTGAGLSAGAIVSAGQDQPTSAAQQVAQCLADTLTAPVLLYPTQVRELGGTTNEIGKAMRALGSRGFVHVELNFVLREGLRGSQQLQHRLGLCLAKVRS